MSTAATRIGRRSGTPTDTPTGATPVRSGRSSLRRWPWLVALGLVGVVFFGAVYAVFFSPLLGVKTVTVVGVSDQLAAQIKSVVAVPDGTPLARVDLDAVTATVNGVPEVSSADVARGWPDSLVVTASARIPVAVTSANGQLWLLDATGDPYLAVPAAPPGLVTIALGTPSVGDPPTMAAVTVAGALTPEFRAQVATVSARTAFDIELTLTDGRKVLWGEPTASVQKMQILPALLTAQQGTEYNITDPTLVSVR